MTTPFLLPGTQVAVRGRRWTVLGHTRYRDCDALHLSGCGPPEDDGLTVLLPFDRPRVIGTNGRIRRVSERRWTTFVRRRVMAATPFGGLSSVARADVRIVPYQLEPGLAMLRYGHLRILLADAVGLGKTVQTGIILAELSAADPELRALIVTPAGLRQQWRAELQARFALGSTLADTAWLQAAMHDLPPDANPWSLPGTFVTSVDLVKRPEVLHALEAVTWDLLVVDEAHGAAPGTARLNALRGLGARARRILLLTATPPHGEPAHMEALLSIGQLSSDDRLLVFRRTRAEAGERAGRKTILLGVRPAPAERRMHAALGRYTAALWREASRRGDAGGRLAATLLQKRALSSPQALAISARRRLRLLENIDRIPEAQLSLPLWDEDPLPDEVPDAVLGGGRLEDGEGERAALEHVVRLADAAAVSGSKMRVLLRLLERVGEPVLVFTEYRDTLERLAAACRRLSPQVMHGGMNVDEREAAVAQFTSSGRLLLATDAASEGLNLHPRCRTVVHFELPWTPMRLEQRTGRVDRFGQHRRVHEILLVGRHRGERLVLAPLIRRLRAGGGGEMPLQAVGESAVAAMLLGGEPLPSSTAASFPAPPPEHLAYEARIEAQRLSACRHLQGRHPRTSPSGPLLVTGQPGPRCSVRAIATARLEGAGGLLVAEEVLGVEAHLLCRQRPVDPCPVNAVVQELIQRFRPTLTEALQRHLAETREDVRVAARRLMNALVERERALLLARTPVAPALVQAGLFDRRALARSAEDERRADASLSDADDHAARLGSPEPPTWRIDVVAVRLSSRAT